MKLVCWVYSHIFSLFYYRGCSMAHIYCMSYNIALSKWNWGAGCVIDKQQRGCGCKRESHRPLMWGCWLLKVCPFLPFLNIPSLTSEGKRLWCRRWWSSECVTAVRSDICVCVWVCVCGWATAGFKQWMDVVLREVLNTLRGVRISTSCLLAARSDRWLLLKLGRQLKRRQEEPIPLVCNHAPSPQWCCGANMWEIHCLISN